MVRYDPFNWEVLSDGSIVVYRWDYRYYGGDYRTSLDLHLITWNADGSNDIVSGDVFLKDYTQRIIGNSDRLILMTQSYWPPVTDLYSLIPEDDG